MSPPEKKNQGCVVEGNNRSTRQQQYKGLAYAAPVAVEDRIMVSSLSSGAPGAEYRESKGLSHAAAVDIDHQLMVAPFSSDTARMLDHAALRNSHVPQPGAYAVHGVDYVPGETSGSFDLAEFFESHNAPNPEHRIATAPVRWVSRKTREMVRSKKRLFIGLAGLGLLAVLAISVGLSVGNNKKKAAGGTIIPVAPSPVPTLSLYPTVGEKDWIQLGQYLTGRAPLDEFGQQVTLSGDGTILAVSSSNQGDGGRSHVEVYQLQNSSWVQMGESLYQDFNSSDFGLSFDGSRMIIGTTSLTPGVSGEVKVLSWSGSSWSQLGDVLSGGTQYYGFAVAVSADGSVIALSDPWAAFENEEFIGQIELFKWNELAWMPLGQTIYGDAAGDISGTSIALNFEGSVVAIGANGDTGSSSSECGRGYVRVYEYSAGSGIWLQRGPNFDAHQSYGCLFGYAVALSRDGSVVAIGDPEYQKSPIQRSSGSVQVFKFHGSMWHQVGETIVGDALDQLGTSISLSGDGSILACGAPVSASLPTLVHGLEGFQQPPGYVMVLVWDRNSWIAVGPPRINTVAGEGKGFGLSVSISANGAILAIGDPESNTVGGAVVFEVVDD